MLLLPSQLSTNEVQKQQLSHILDIHAGDLPCIISLDAELQLWLRKWEMEAKKFDTPEKVLMHTDKDFFLNISTISYNGDTSIH